jgi:hypothetical protein
MTKSNEKVIAKNYSLAQLLNSPLQMFMGVLSVIVLLLLGKFVTAGIEFRRIAQMKMPAGYEFP